VRLAVHPEVVLVAMAARPTTLMLVSSATGVPEEGRTMGTTPLGSALDHPTAEQQLVLAWRVERLRQLGLPLLHAEVYAHLVDWHAVAGLVARGCTPMLALRIVH
jgi:hypothetical protein